MARGAGGAGPTPVAAILVDAFGEPYLCVDATGVLVLAKEKCRHGHTLFRVERTIADSPRDKKEQVRRAKSRPLVDRFFEWCDAEVDKLLDESPRATAIGYARNQHQRAQPEAPTSAATTARS